MNRSFAAWLNRELDNRGWSRSEAARRGEFSASMLDKVISGYSQPGLDFCNGVARAFKLPLEDILRKAGILPPINRRDGTLASLIRRIEGLPSDTRQATIGLINVILDYQEKPADVSVAEEEEPSPEHRLAVFRAAFAALSEEEQDQVIAELQAQVAVAESDPADSG